MMCLDLAFLGARSGGLGGGKNFLEGCVGFSGP